MAREGEDVAGRGECGENRGAGGTAETSGGETEQLTPPTREGAYLHIFYSITPTFLKICSFSLFSAGILEQSIGARNRLGIRSS